MANSFFNFDSSLKAALDLKNDEPLLPDDDDDDDDDDGYENEEEYDALNDETFGKCEDLDDWEKQHEKFAEFNESSRYNETLESSISQLGLEEDSLDDEEPTELLTFPKNSSVWTYNPQKNGEVFSSLSVLSSLEKASKTFIEAQTHNITIPFLNATINNNVPPIQFPKQPGKICTVEELEKNLIKNSQQNAQILNKALRDAKPGDNILNVLPPIQAPNQIPLNHVNLQQVHGQQRPLMQFPPHAYLMQHSNVRLPPPGLPPFNLPPPTMRHFPPHPMMGPGYRMMHPPPHLMQPNAVRPPIYPYPIPLNAFNFPSSPLNNMPPSQIMSAQQKATIQSIQMQQRQQQQQVVNNERNRRYPNKDNAAGDFRDEYAGLMTMKDKQWLLNIQMIQLNTGTPYFDDFYYTIYKERRTKPRKELTGNEKTGRFQNNRQRRNSERQDNNNLTPRVYTPLQFENSLGKLQCGSVTAPRKIIDMDIMQPEKDQELPPVSKDSKKTKQYLLELEVLYALLLRAEDITNPMYISNMEKHREMKQKQRLRELEQAPTPEQKQEVLRLFKEESEPIIEHQIDYILKILHGFVQEEKFSSFLTIRKGKMFLLRLLNHLSVEQFSGQLLEIWSRVLLSLPIIGRRDTAGDNLLPKLYPHFKSFIQTCTMSDILNLTSGLVEVIKQENNRSTPLGHAGKSPLYFVVLNKLGVSALTYLFLRTEQIFSTIDPTEIQTKIWTGFLENWAKQSDSVSKVAMPLEPIPLSVFKKHIERFDNNLLLSSNKKATLEKFYVDANL